MPEYHLIYAIAKRIAPTCAEEPLAGVCRAVEHKLSGNPASDAEIEAALVEELGATSPHVSAAEAPDAAVPPAEAPAEAAAPPAAPPAEPPAA